MPRPKAKTSPLAEKLKGQMRRDSAGGMMLTAYLAQLRERDPGGADSLESDIALAFSTEEGLRVLILLEKAVLEAGVPNGSPDSALRELNAARNLVLEIRRYVANG